MKEFELYCRLEKEIENYLDRSPHTKGISTYGKLRIQEGIANLLCEAFKLGSQEGRSMVSNEIKDGKQN